MKRFLCGLVSVVMCNVFLFAAVSEKVNYQGRLEESGKLVTGDKTMEFRIYNALTGGTQQWTSGQRTVTVKRGLFNYMLGKDTAFPSTLFENSPLYLEVIVAGTTLAPREEIVGSPYAITAKSAFGLTTTGEYVVISSNVYTIGYSSAAKFYGDGSGLYGITATGADTDCRLSTGTLVKKAGDTMTGQLIISSITSGNNYLVLNDTSIVKGNLTVQGKLTGDGSGLTGTSTVDSAVRLDTGTIRTDLNNVTASTGTLVKKAGDTMTGQLIISSITSGNNYLVLNDTSIVKGNLTVQGKLTGDGSGLTGTSTVDSAVRLDTGTIRTDLNIVKVDTGTLRTDLNALDSQVSVDTNTLNTNKLNLSGGAMTGNLNMNTFNVINIASITATSDLYFGAGTTISTYTASTGDFDIKGDIRVRGQDIGDNTAAARITMGATTTSIASSKLNMTGTAADRGLYMQSASRYYGEDADAQYRLLVSTHLYVVGYSSAAKFFGDGSGLYGVTGAIDSAVRLDTGTIRTDLNAVKVDTGTLRTDLNTDISNLNAVKVDTGTLRTDLAAVKVDTGTLRTDLAVVKLDTGTLRTDLAAVKVDTGTLRTDLAAVKLDTGTLRTDLAAVKLDTGTLRTDLAAVKVDTGTLRTDLAAVKVDTGTLRTDLAAVKVDTGTLASVKLSTYIAGGRPTVASDLQINGEDIFGLQADSAINISSSTNLFLSFGVAGTTATFNGGVKINGTLQVAGTKNFVQDHPTDPTKKIVYVCLEGGEAGTYIRGSAKLEKGIAKVKLPEHFSLVTNDDGLTVLVTLREECKGVYVVSASTKEIVIKELNSGKSNAKFDYLVQGVRLGYENHKPIQNK